MSGIVCELLLHAEEINREEKDSVFSSFYVLFICLIHSHNLG